MEYCPEYSYIKSRARDSFVPLARSYNITSDDKT